MVAEAAMGGAYEFVKVASANLREKDDSWNPTLGGFVAGATLGLRCQPVPLGQLDRSSINALILCSSHPPGGNRLRRRCGGTTGSL